MISKQTDDGDVRILLGAEEVAAMRAANGKRIAEQPPEAIQTVNRIAYQAPWSARYLSALVLIIMAPKPYSRLRDWLYFAPQRLVSFLSAILGPRVDSSVYDSRMAECMTCEFASRVLVRRKPFVKTYCKNCRCPKWPLAELGYKNRLRNWACPAGKFEGKPKPPEWSAIIEREKELELERMLKIDKERSRQLPIVRGGCGR